MTEKITSKTSIKRIQELVAIDFDVQIDEDTAKEIKQQGERGCVVWGPKWLKTVSGIHITPKEHMR